MFKQNKKQDFPILFIIINYATRPFRLATKAAGGATKDKFFSHIFLSC